MPIALVFLGQIAVTIAMLPIGLGVKRMEVDPDRQGSLLATS